jgi:hypothetical protein
MQDCRVNLMNFGPPGVARPPFRGLFRAAVAEIPGLRFW